VSAPDKPESIVERADRERAEREKKEGRARASAMAEAAAIEKLILASYSELQRRGEHAGAHEVAEFLVANGVRLPRERAERVIVPGHWPKLGLSLRADE
jgi:ferritin-like metal-binding protein YciE